MSQQSNLHKSEAGWQRFRDRTGAGSRARGAQMDHRVQSDLGKENVGSLRIPAYEGDEGTKKKRRGRKRRVVAPNGRTF